MTAPERAPLGAVLAVLVALITLSGGSSPALMAIAVAALALLTGTAWPDLLELPSPLGTRLVVSATGILGAVAALGGTARTSPVSALLMVCAAAVFAAFVHQMLRRDRHQLTVSLTGTVAGVFVAGISACWVLAQSRAQEAGSVGVLAAIALGVATALLLNTLPLHPTARLALSVASGTAVTALLAHVLEGVHPALGVGCGLLVTVGAGSAHLLAGSSLTAREPVSSLAVSALPVATVGVVAYLAVTLLT